MARWALLVLPAMHVSTPAVYRTFDQMGLGDGRPLQEEPDWAAWARLPARELLGLLVNDLEAPAFAVAGELGPLRQRLEAHFGQIVRMSGSGSSLFTLYDAQNAAETAALEARNRFHISALAVPVAPAWTDDVPL
jgi:4-diphosphocytidyl-2-C-methyl-D-erythritol kinase